MGISREGFRVYPGDLPAVFAGVHQGLQDAGVTVLTADEATGTITATWRRSAWGRDFTVRVWQDDPGLVRVKVRSDSRFGIVDWGQNQSSLRRLFFAIDHAVTDPHSPPDWHPDPVGRHEQRYWDGAAWTDQVSDAGDVTTDPL